MSKLIDSATSALGIANVGRALAFAVVLAIIAGVMGLYYGKQWQIGVEARTDLQELQGVLDAQRQQLSEMRELRERYAKANEDQRLFHDQQRVRLLDWMLAPGPADGARIGDDGLGLWNAANAGVAAGGAVAGAARAVSPPAAGTGRLGEDARGQPRVGDGGAGRLRDPPGRAGSVGRDRDDGSR